MLSDTRQLHTVEPKSESKSRFWPFDQNFLPEDALLDSSNWEETQNTLEGLDIPSGLGTPREPQEEVGDVWDTLLSLLLTRPGLMPFVIHTHAPPDGGAADILLVGSLFSF